MTDVSPVASPGGRRKATLEDVAFAADSVGTQDRPVPSPTAPPSGHSAASVGTGSVGSDGLETQDGPVASTVAPPSEPEIAAVWTEPVVEDPPAEPTAWDRPIVTATRGIAVVEPAERAAGLDPSAELSEDPFYEEPGPESSKGPSSLTVSWGLCVLALVAAAVAGTAIADAEGWLSVSDVVPRTGALVASWAAVVLLVRRLGGRFVVIGCFAAVVLGLVGGFPEPWALAGAGVTGATAFALLAMLLTRPAGGFGLLRELLISAFIGLVGAVVVAGYDVELRPYRFRVLILAVVLGVGLVLAWRLGHGAKSIGRRGAVLIVLGVGLLVSSLAYAQAVRSWGSPDLVNNLADLRDWVSDSVGAAPRPIEALVGFPALIWGVSVRQRRRQGWWMCAFGALGAAGVTSSLIQIDVSLSESLLSTGYDVVLGAVIGLIVVLMDRILTHGGGRRADSAFDVDPERPEPARFEALL